MEDKILTCCLFNHRREIRPAFAAEFSHMKYGDPASTHNIAKKILNIIRKDPRAAKAIAAQDLVLTSSPYGYVPTAAAAIVIQIAKLLRLEGVNVDIMKISRSGAMGETHYCAMSKEARAEFMKLRSTWIDDRNQKLIEGRFVLGIDDLSATGFHLEDMGRLIKSTKAKDFLLATYIRFSPSMAESDSGAEGYISRYKVKSTLDLIPHFKKPTDDLQELILNTRTLKFILQVTPASDTDLPESIKRKNLIRFIKSCDDHALSIIKDAIYSSDGYTDFDKFTEGIGLITHEIATRIQNTNPQMNQEFNILLN